MTRETVLVLGTGQWAAQTTARSLARAGFRVIGAWEGGRLAGRTRYCSDLVRVPPTSESTAFVTAVERLCQSERIAAVMPLTDEALGALLARRPAAASWTVVGPTEEEFARLCDKVGLLATAAAAGIASPVSGVVTAERRAHPLPPLPGYVKAVSGADAGRPAGRPIRVTDARSRDLAVADLIAGGRDVLVQEEVTGRNWRFHFVRSRGDVAHVAARALAEHPVHVGQSTVWQFCASPPPLTDAALALLDAVGYVGAGSIQLVERDGSWLVHDVNLRMPASVAGTIAAGLDLPRLAVELALGYEPPLEPGRVRKIRLVSLPGELAALRDAIGGVPVGRSARAISGGIALAALAPRRRLAPFDITDPLPTLAALTALRSRRRASANGSVVPTERGSGESRMTRPSR